MITESPVTVTESPPPVKTETRARKRHEVRLKALIIPLAIGAILLFVPRPASVEPHGWQLLAIFVATVAAIVARALPMAAVTLISIAIILLTGTLELETVLAGFGNDSVWLIVSAFFLAGAFIRTGLGRRIAYWFMAAFGQRTLGLSYSLATTDLVLAPFIPSHTARSGGAVFPILKSVARTFVSGEQATVRTAGFLTVVAYQCSIVISGMFLTSMAANPLIAQFAAQEGVQLTWRLWALAAVMPGLASLILVPLIVYAVYPPAIRHTPEARTLARHELAALGPMSRDEITLCVVFAGLLVAWALGPTLGVESTTAVLAAIAILLLSGVLLWDDVAREHEAWTTFVWFAALVMMATQLGRLGVTQWFATSISSAVGDVNWAIGFAVLSLAYFYSHYLFASNTAHVSAMYAPFLVIAIAIGTPPALAALVLAFFSNLFAGLTHYGAGAAPVFFGANYVALGTWWRIGALLSVVNIVIWVVLGGIWWKVLGLW
jgi:DASS family divalent anion:Na+ symporter